MHHPDYHPKIIFISRNLTHDSPFLKKLKGKPVHIIAESLVGMSAIKIREIPPSDWIFFYSKNGVRHFLDQVSHTEISSNCRWAAMGQGTAKAMQEYDIEPDFIGKTTPELTAKAFFEVADGQHVLFPCAKNSRQSIAKLLAGRIKATHLPVYNNYMQDASHLPDSDILVFTSPMNVKAWFLHKKMMENQHFIAIGTTTAKALEQQGIQKINIAKNPSEIALADEVCILLKG